MVVALASSKKGIDTIKSIEKYFEKLTLTLLSVSTLTVFSPNVLAEEPRYEYINEEQTWGLAAVIRSASVPYVNSFELDDSEWVSTFIPMLYFENKFVYVKGLMGGIYLYNSEDSDWNVSALGRLRFVDIPAKMQNELGADVFDFGLRSEYQYSDKWATYAEIMTRKESHWHINVGTEGHYYMGDLQILPHVSLRYKSEDFNTFYYGLNAEKVEAGIDAFVGVRASYHMVSNLYLLGAANVQILDNPVYDAFVIDNRIQTEYYLGFGFFNDKDTPRKTELNNKHYLKLSHGWGTPSNLGDILSGNIEGAPYNSRITILFYGYPLTDELFSLPLDIYLTPGLGWHWSHENQASSQEYILAIKAYYTLSWPFEWRLGVAEGVSHTSKINSLEKEEFKEKGYEPNHLLNYLDFSIDVNLGSLFTICTMDNVWLGYSIHHRSAIFEQSSQYGRIKGGSNYNTITLTLHF